MKIIKKHLGLCLSFMVLILYNSTVPVLNKDNGTLTVRKVTDFKLDGHGNSKEWKNTEWIDLKQKEGNPDDYQTKVKVLYSVTGIYFLFDCEDKKLVSTLKKDNENLWNEDVVEVFLWTDENFPVYFEYELSPMDYELPLIVPNFDGYFYGWLPWHYEGERKVRHKTGIRGGRKESGAKVEGWRAEIFIPFELLKPLNNVPPETGTKWRANMYRIDYDNGRSIFFWQKVKPNFHDYKSFGTFIFE